MWLSGRASEFKSKDPEFDPLAGQGKCQVFLYPSESIFVPTYLCLTPFKFLCSARTHSKTVVHTIMIPCYVHLSENSSLVSGGMVTHKYYTVYVR